MSVIDNTKSVCMPTCVRICADEIQKVITAMLLLKLRAKAARKTSANGDGSTQRGYSVEAA